MYKFVKRAVILMLVLCMALSVAGCIGSGNKGGEQTGDYGMSADEVIASMPEDLKGTTIKFLNWYDPHQREEGAVIDAFEQATGCTVEVIVRDYGEAYNTALASMVATGEAPDVLRLRTPDPALLKLLHNTDVMGFDFEASSIWDKPTMELYSVNDVSYAVNLTDTPFFLPWVYYYRTDIFENMGYDDPYELWKNDEWTWEALREICLDWVKQGETYRGATIEPGNVVAATRGIDLIKYDGSKYSLNINDADALESWRFVCAASQELWLTSGGSAANTRNPLQLIAAIDSTLLQGKSEYARTHKKLGEFGVVPFPAWESKEDGYYVPMAEYLAFGVAQGAKNPKAVPYFLAYYLNFDNYDKETFFYDEHCAEIHNELVAMPNRYLAMSGEIFTEEEGAFSLDNLRLYVAPEQLTTHLQEQEYVMQDAIDKANDALAACEGQK